MAVQLPFRASFAGSLAGMIEPLRQLGFAPATTPKKVEIDFGETVTGIDIPLCQGSCRIARAA